MSAEKYQLVFDLVTEGYTAWRAALLPACIGIGLAVMAIAVPGKVFGSAVSGRRVFQVVSSLGAAVVLGMGAVVLYQTFREYKQLRSALQANEIELVIGRVTSFTPEGPDGHPRESFAVGKVTFNYSSSDITSAFHWSARRGGPIREGLYVRIVSVRGAIARLELMQPSDESR